MSGGSGGPALRVGLRGSRKQELDRQEVTQGMPNRVALITGAGSGIGRATAIALSAAGFSIALIGRRRDPLEETAALLGDSARPLLLPCDVANPEQVSTSVQQTIVRFGRLDALINNAGSAPLATIHNTTPALLQECFAVNTLAPAYLIHAAWGVFMEQARAAGATGTSPRATIVNVSSMATKDPFAGFFAYAAAKAATNLMAHSCAREGGAIGVRAFAVAPGAVETPMLRANFSESAIHRSRTLAPEAVARVIVECVQGERDAENGQVIWLPSP